MEGATDKRTPESPHCDVRTYTQSSTSPCHVAHRGSAPRAVRVRGKRVLRQQHPFERDRVAAGRLSQRVVLCERRVAVCGGVARAHAARCEQP
eukprot:3668962-Prymnesium_polylepis.1